MISASVIGIIAQRLVRRLCPQCLTIDNNSLGKLSLLQIDLNSFGWYNPEDSPLQRVHDSRGPPDCLRQHEERRH